MNDKDLVAPQSSAVRVALWRAIHVQVDSPPHVIKDEVGYKLLAPDDSWRQRPDMDPDGTRFFRASIIARARYIEDLILELSRQSIKQYVILGAGLDTFAQRRPEIASHLKVFEVDQAGPQKWKAQRLIELGYGIPEWLRFVPVDFEVSGDWWQNLIQAGFDINAPAVVTSTGVSMYLTVDAISAMMRQVATLAPGSTLAMTFLLPLEMAAPEIREGMERSAKGAAASGTPFISFFKPEQIISLAKDAGFKKVEHVSAFNLNTKYFADRSDDLRLPSNSEEMIIAST
ncbi:MAG: class I SAM-dependent methyltransferase [Candidatus Obscuribacter sp.]|nr:class I SAM-dependent methyltransferase [Candidatus Obscuribacter sp.]